MAVSVVDDSATGPRQFKLFGKFIEKLEAVALFWQTKQGEYLSEKEEVQKGYRPANGNGE
jgi:hypothetical protein